MKCKRCGEVMSKSYNELSNTNCYTCNCGYMLTEFLVEEEGFNKEFINDLGLEVVEMSKYKTFYVGNDEHIARKLEDVAEKKDRSESWIVKQALKKYFEESDNDE